MLGRIGIEQLAPVGLHLCSSSLPQQDASDAVLDFRVFRIKPDRVLVVIIGLVEPMLHSQDVGEVVVGPGIVGVELRAFS